MLLLQRLACEGHIVAVQRVSDALIDCGHIQVAAAIASAFLAQPCMPHMLYSVRVALSVSFGVAPASVEASWREC